MTNEQLVKFFQENDERFFAETQVSLKGQNRYSVRMVFGYPVFDGGSEKFKEFKYRLNQAISGSKPKSLETFDKIAKEKGTHEAKAQAEQLHFWADNIEYVKGLKELCAVSVRVKWDKDYDGKASEANSLYILGTKEIPEDFLDKMDAAREKGKKEFYTTSETGETVEDWVARKNLKFSVNFEGDVYEFVAKSGIGSNLLNGRSDSKVYFYSKTTPAGRELANDIFDAGNEHYKLANKDREDIHLEWDLSIKTKKEFEAACNKAFKAAYPSIAKYVDDGILKVASDNEFDFSYTIYFKRGNTEFFKESVVTRFRRKLRESLNRKILR